MLTPKTAADPNRLLIQFAKWPEPGRVKTRLAVAMGDDGAMQAHIELTCAVLANLAATGIPVSFWWDRAAPASTEPAGPILDHLRNAEVPEYIQNGHSLGERMRRAIEESLASAREVMIVGSDCPSVDPAHIQTAFGLLANVDVVLGPSDDGGFVLIGARRPLPQTLADVAWGTPMALEQTVEKLKTAGYSVALAEPRWDVDEPEDWARFLEEKSRPAESAGSV
ncbi:TIGR04282 family arsenosugar biosynthesis glycosyltransferase [Marinobacter sp. BGYM27]|uniref:TIGR04282 family arsenosugar biosynthesis glycosyltransferase n=1 Tax=Marinobacter sp. BGYM27 TaxID=2975597 RepID=UPI0021A54FA6|nr:TIGR04282 family arsenosugar biosynthesis glycosyltransferase [Marinobacter sp. BGYM27]MDG5498699.1 TIGR04282 family arsenosugar biosynthesis glycosyltransferase [Marinobacter sp. BGYM27]